MGITKSVALIAAFLTLLATAPVEAAKKHPQLKQFEAMQSKYASAIRWNEFEMAWGLVDPEYRSKNPLSDLEKERLKQIQVTGYTEKTQTFLMDGGIEQTVEIRLINRNTQAERKVLDTQVWRWDEKAKRWWLATGLPDFTARSF